MSKNSKRQPVAAGKATAKKHQAREARLIRNVILRQESLTRKDIRDWQKARQEATRVDDPKQVQLQTLYEEVMLDALMTSQVGLRIDKSQGADYTLKFNGEIDEEATMRLKDSGLYEQFVELIIEANFYSASLCEVSYDTLGPVLDLVPRKHVSPSIGRFYPDLSGDKYESYREDADFGKWLLEFYPRKRDLGILNKAVPYVLMKKFALSCWSELCEIFGIPPRVLKTNTGDDQMLDRAQQMMREIGSAAWYIIDSTESFEFAQASSTNGDVYKNLISTCDQQISLLNLAAVLGQDTENGNRSKEESSSKLLESVVSADKRTVETNFNRIVLPALAAIGFLKPGLRLEINKEENIAEIWKMTYEACQHFDVDPEWVKNKFGIEVTGRKNFDVEPPQNPEDDDNEPTGQGGRGFFLYAPQAGASDGGALTALNEGLIQRVADRESPYWDAELFGYLCREFLNAARTAFEREPLASGEVTYNAPDDIYLAAMEQNLFHFSAAKTLAEVQELNEAFRASANYNDFRDRASAICTKFNDRWQRTEYRTAVQVAEQASAYRSMRSRQETFPIWVYRTVGDGQVRPEHASLDGLTLPASDPAWKKIYPPNDWGCRCWVDAIMADEHEGGYDDERAKVRAYMKSAEWKRSVAQGWGVNRAETAEIFSANQMYIKKFPTKAKKLLGRLHYNDYGLDSFGKCLSRATAEFIEYSGKPADWLAENGRFKDFSGKTVAMPRQAFDKHTQGAYEGVRVPLLNAVPEALRYPDEVWLNDYVGAFNNYNYIKYYRGKVINVVCGIDDNQMHVRTWFEIEQNPKGKSLPRSKDPRWRYRRGLLIKK